MSRNLAALMCGVVCFVALVAIIGPAFYPNMHDPQRFWLLGTAVMVLMFVVAFDD